MKIRSISCIPLFPRNDLWHMYICSESARCAEPLSFRLIGVTLLMTQGAFMNICMHVYMYRPSSTMQAFGADGMVWDGKGI